MSVQQDIPLKPRTANHGAAGPLALYQQVKRYILDRIQSGKSDIPRHQADRGAQILLHAGGRILGGKIFIGDVKHTVNRAQYNR